MNQLQYFRLLVILNGAVPSLILAWDSYRGQLGVNSVNYALHVTGILSLLFLLISLLMTPLRWITGWGGWIAFRRAFGLYGFFYSILHVVIYIGFDRALNVTSALHEIWMRRYLQIGTAAFFLMIPLAVTSTNSMIRIMGTTRWKRLHRLAYFVAILGVVHYYMLVKSDVRQPLAFAAVLSVLLCGRFLRHFFELREAAKKPTKIPFSDVTVSLAPARSREVAVDSTKPVHGWKGELKVAAIFQETHDVKTFRLTPGDEGSLPFAYKPGQFLNIQLTIDGKRVNRSYTIASSPTRTDACELSIKREPMGIASPFLHDQIKVGDVLNVSGPYGTFVFTGKESPGVLLIAGGVGITPLMSILRYLTDRAWAGEIYFLIVTKTELDLIFYDEIQWLKRRFPRLNVCVTLTRCAPDNMWKGGRGRATEALLRGFVPDLKRFPVYLCGPNEMMSATKHMLLSMGLPEVLIKTEVFGPNKAKLSPTESVEDSNGLFKAKESNEASFPFPPEITSLTRSVSFALSNVRADVTSDTTVLEAAEASSIELAYECRSGICGQCKTRLIEGTVDMECQDALSAAEKKDGWILACQARPKSDLVVEA